jgi:hypothetical protein
VSAARNSRAKALLAGSTVTPSASTPIHIEKIALVGGKEIPLRGGAAIGRPNPKKT